MSFNSAGIKIGHATNEAFHTGCTVFLCPEGTVGSVDVRGPAPGSRELALLVPDKPLHYVNGLVLTGGSAFGLATGDGVMRYLAEKGIGHPTPIRPVPIVPAAVVYDLFLSGGQFLPGAAMGYDACREASEDNDLQGNVGVGAGVTVGKWGGRERMMKGGLGLATAVINDLVVSAAAVVNAVGDVVAADGSVLAGARAKAGAPADGAWLAAEDPWWRFPDRPTAPPGAEMTVGEDVVTGTNTTLAVVMTNAVLTTVEANRLAQRAHDGLAIAIRPVHTTHDGDITFALGTGSVVAAFDLVANVAVEMVAEAIRNGVRHAVTVAGIPGLAGEG